MKKSTIITIICFALGIVILTAGFILLTDNNISDKLFATTTTKKEEEKPVYEPMNFFDVDVSQYITLGQYKDLVVEVDQIEVSQEEIDDRINVLLAQEDEFTKVREGNVTEKVIFSFDYTGYFKKSDGSRGDAFDNGAAKDQLAYIDGDTLVTIYDDQTGTFIDGFAQGLLGATVGETFSIDITFPSNYHSSSLSGQKVEFEVTVNYIAETHFTDGWVKEYTSDAYKTTDEFVQYLKDSINPQIEEANLEVLWAKIAENATLIKIPQQEFDYIYNSMKEEVEGYVIYSQYYFGKQLDYAGVLKELGFEDEEDFEKYVTEYANAYIKSEMVLHAVMQAENITATDEEYRIFLDSLMESYNKTEEEILDMYSEKEIRNAVAFKNLDMKVLSWNKFVVKDAE